MPCFPSRIDFDQAAIFQFLDMHGNSAIAEIQPVREIVQVQALVLGQQFQNLNANFRAERFKISSPLIKSLM